MAQLIATNEQRFARCSDEAYRSHAKITDLSFEVFDIQSETIINHTPRTMFQLRDRWALFGGLSLAQCKAVGSLPITSSADFIN